MLNHPKNEHSNDVSFPANCAQQLLNSSDHFSNRYTPIHLALKLHKLMVSAFGVPSDGDVKERFDRAAQAYEDSLSGVQSEPAPAPVVEEVEDEVVSPAEDALVYEISATGEASGIAPEADEE